MEEGHQVRASRLLCPTGAALGRGGSEVQGRRADNRFYRFAAFRESNRAPERELFGRWKVAGRSADTQSMVSRPVVGLRRERVGARGFRMSHAPVRYQKGARLPRIWRL